MESSPLREGLTTEEKQELARLRKENAREMDDIVVEGPGAARSWATWSAHAGFLADLFG